MGVKVVRRATEPVGIMLRRLKKLMERDGFFRRLLERSSYTKPSQRRRQDKRRKQFNVKHPKEPRFERV